MVKINHENRTQHKTNQNSTVTQTQTKIKIKEKSDRNNERKIVKNKIKINMFYYNWNFCKVLDFEVEKIPSEVKVKIILPDDEMVEPKEYVESVLKLSTLPEWLSILA